MKVISFMRQGFELVPVEVEVSLSPGLPQIAVMGLPDTIIRESTARIRSALRQQGFELPAAKQILVHLRPTHLKKSSRGLDLAIAAALLWETGQIPNPNSDQKIPAVYGELSLKGEVIRPDDLEDLPPEFGNNGVLTGEGGALGFPTLCLRDLRGMESPRCVDGVREALQLTPPALPEIRIAEDAAGIIAASVVGHHHLLLAGPPGSGKTTAAELVHALLDVPDEKTFSQSRRIHRSYGETLAWRPLVQPHHSVTPIAMIGGGLPPHPGEITRAHGGLLIMDEFLEFQPQVQEALREPLEDGEIRLARGGFHCRFPADFLLVGTSNLCPCGRYLPGRNTFCRCSRNQRQSYFSRLRGPFVDRFPLLAFTVDWGKDLNVPTAAIHENIQKALRFQREQRQQTIRNSQLTDENILADLTRFQRQNLLPGMTRSRRRYLALLRVARTFADLDGSKAIENRHLEKSREVTVRTFTEIEHADI